MNTHQLNQEQFALEASRVKSTIQGPSTTSSRMLHYVAKSERLEDPVLNFRALVMNTHFYKGLRDRLFETFGTGAITILYEMGFGYGEVMGRKIVEMAKTSVSLYRSLIKLGYGHFDIQLLQQVLSGLKREPTVRLKNSFFASAVGNSGQSECHIIRGILAGAARLILEKDFDCFEDKCISNGDSHCEFRLKERSKAFLTTHK